MAGPPLGGLRFCGDIGIDAVGWCPLFTAMSGVFTHVALSFAIIHLGELAKLDHGERFIRRGP
jgi:hypothetical protein